MINPRGQCTKANCPCHVKELSPYEMFQKKVTERLLSNPLELATSLSSAQRITQSAYFKDLEAVLDEHFPKGKCKERGAALMLFAQANILHDQGISSHLPLTQQESDWEKEWQKTDAYKMLSHEQRIAVESYLSSYRNSLIAEMKNRFEMVSIDKQ